MKQKQHTIDVVFILSLFCVFTISCLAVLFFGSHIYQKTIQESQYTFQTRTTLNYIHEKMLQNQEKDHIDVIYQDDLDILVLNDKQSKTYIYYDDHYLKEVTLAHDQEFQKNYGNNLLKIRQLDIEKVYDQVIKVEVKGTDGYQYQLFVPVI